MLGPVISIGLAVALMVSAGCRPVDDSPSLVDTCFNSELAAADDSLWRDRSPHTEGFLAPNGERLHYLDWGGEGEPLVLLTGLGSTAHTFDDFGNLVGGALAADWLAG